MIANFDPAIQLVKDSLRHHGCVPHGFNILQKDIDRLIVTDDCIFSEGWMYTVYPGKTLAERGLDVDPSRHYLHTNRVAAILPQGC